VPPPLPLKRAGRLAPLVGALLSLTVLPIAGAAASNSAPTAPAAIPAIPGPRDAAWPGTITLAVDASDVTRGIFQVTETIPVSTAGVLTLLYPEWLPGHHSPVGTITKLAGLKISSGGNLLPWKRDPVDVFAFHVEVPTGATAIKAEFQFLAPSSSDQGRIVTTPDMLNLQWDSVAVYPAGYFVRRIPVEASLKLPAGWKAATALETAAQDVTTIHYRPVSFETLMDSPVFAGAYVRVETLAPSVRLNIVADRPEQLEATEEQIGWHRNLVIQAVKLFGAQHYDHYDFLLALSDRQGSIGLEHHRSSENGVTGSFFTDWKASLTSHSLLPHEYTHSWNGKFRRGADLWTPDYRTPMQDSLLWVYEGQTQFWGQVLAVRAGLVSKEDALGSLAATAATYENRRGRTWRPLIDTTNDPIIARRSPQPWTSWQRSEDYYSEGLLIWLDADTLIRERSAGVRSLDDFARAFFGTNDRDWGELTYTRADVVRTLNDIQPNDWDTFLRTRVDDTAAQAPLEGIARGGYRLVYTDTPTNWFKTSETSRKVSDLSFSVGFIINRDAQLTAVAWDSPAFDAGLTVGTRIIAVNGRAYDADDLKQAIKAKKAPISLLVRTGDIFRTVELTYSGGLRYPKLEKVDEGPAFIDALLAARP
jgi:predicted metalloprotease with PDZ domain